MTITTFVPGVNTSFSTELNSNFTHFTTALAGPGNNDVASIAPPVGGIIAWAKTFDTQDSGTTTSTTANKLVQSGQNFLTTVSVGNVVYNTTDLTFAYVTVVDSDTQLTLSADIMVSGEAFTIYSTPALPSAWAECNGQVLSDATSPYNGATLPNLNGSTEGTSLFLRGARFSGSTGGVDNHAHTVSFPQAVNNAGTAFGNSSGSNSTGAASNIPPYYQVVWIMRVR